MKILTVDIGTGTQDIYLYQAGLEIENGYKLVLPSPTMIVNKEIKEATRKEEAVVLTGVTMGGGPSHWAARDHAQAGYQVYATPEAARSFDDDLDKVKEIGIEIISADEVSALPSSVMRLELMDFDFHRIYKTFNDFGISLEDLDAAGLAVFDHGAAPPEYSDRQFRFDYLAERLKPDLPGPGLSRLAFKRGDIPEKMTRLLALEQSASQLDCRLMVMDTAPAAVLGATLDPVVQARERILAANIGNFHSLAFRLNGDRVEGVFEHHTGLIDREKLEELIRKFAGSVLTHEEIFDDHGHGAIIHDPEPFDLKRGDFNIVVTGPRRNLIRGSNLRPYFAAPFGDMMLTGCFGLLAAIADTFPELGDTIKNSLYRDPGEESGLPPWELD